MALSKVALFPRSFFSWLSILVTRLERLEAEAKAYCDDVAAGLVNRELLKEHLELVTLEIDAFCEGSGSRTNTGKLKLVCTSDLKAVPLSMTGKWNHIKVVPAATLMAYSSVGQ